jgi:hypothetical protein
MQPYSLLITSCNRHDLLEKTIKSFLKTADVQPRQIVIVEDGDTPMPAFLSKYKHLGLTWINNGTRRGQIYSCDRLWQECKYDYAMWMEDDWVFTQGDFITKSFEILEKYPEVVTVTLRGDWNHPLIDDNRFPFKIAQPNWKGAWGGFCFNPGLRRKADYTRIGSYGKHVGYGSHGLGHEMDLSKLYSSMGYVLAALPNHCAHIGGGRSRAIEPLLVQPSRVLIAIKAGHALNYTKWESSESPLFNRTTAWEGKPYGDVIHISTATNTRLQAIRDTWWRDCKAYATLDAKFFYGRLPAGMQRTPEEDEVFLQVEDDYEHLPHKTVAICKWAREHNYDFVFLCDDDTGVYVDRLMIEVQSLPFDYAGHINGGSCSGGCGYFLSRRGMEAVQESPNCWAEDVWIGKCMKSAGIPMVDLPMHYPGYADHYFFKNGFDPSKLHNQIVTMHALRPEDLRDWYAYEKAQQA